MATAFAGDVYQVTVNGLIHNQRTMNTYYWRLLAPVSPGTTVEDVCNALNSKLSVVDGLKALHRACAPSSWALKETWVQRIHPVRVVKFVDSVGNVGNGLRAQTGVTNVSATITRRSEEADRHSIGGVRIPLNPGDVTAGQIVAEQIGNLTALADVMASGFTLDFIGDVEPVMFGKSDDPQVAPTIRPIFQCFVQPTSRVVRRRTVGVGI